ncbi:MAG TPA: hypothetical protein VGF50_13115 [Caulobacteraceae bacterium]|jgi:hypothetical protein
MTTVTISRAWLLVACFLTLGASAAPAGVQRLQQHLPPIAKDNESLPRLAGALTPAGQRVNLGLAKLDASWRAFRRDCKETTRSVKVTMLTPRMFGLLVSDDTSCGAHPSEGQMALVYDLDTGRPVDWAKVLGPRLVKSSTIDSAIDGTNIGFVVATPALHDLYLRQVKAERAGDASWATDCADALADPDLAFEVSPDTKADGLVIWPGDLPHVIQACGDPVTAPTATLRKLGADARFLDEVDAAHRAR